MVEFRKLTGFRLVIIDEKYERRGEENRLRRFKMNLIVVPERTG